MGNHNTPTDKREQNERDRQARQQGQDLPDNAQASKDKPGDKQGRNQGDPKGNQQRSGSGNPGQQGQGGAKPAQQQGPAGGATSQPDADSDKG